MTNPPPKFYYVGSVKNFAGGTRGGFVLIWKLYKPFGKQDLSERPRTHRNSKTSFAIYQCGKTNHIHSKLVLDVILKKSTTLASYLSMFYYNFSVKLGKCNTQFEMDFSVGILPSLNIPSIFFHLFNT